MYLTSHTFQINFEKLNKFHWHFLVECEPGYYDDRCYSECDGCLDRTCTQTRACDTGCLPNRQGKYCEQTCSDHCFVCDQNSGACLLCDTGYGGVGCNMSSPHWFNPYDNTTIPLNGSCADGRFGATCGGVCDNCLEQHGKHRCEKFTGSCLYGCSSPFYGNRCDKICKSCKPEMGKNRTCDVITGECPNGCTSGYYGVLCNMTCGTNCLNKLCNQNNGTCTSGCAAGWQGDNCSIGKSYIYNELRFKHSSFKKSEKRIDQLNNKCME